MRSEPYKQYRSAFVVFGCGDKANKGVIAGKFRGMWGLKVLELADRSKYERGDTFEIDDVAGEYFTMYFAKKASIDCLIWDLQRLKEKMEDAEGQEDKKC